MEVVDEALSVRLLDGRQDVAPGRRAEEVDVDVGRFAWLTRIAVEVFDYPGTHHAFVNDTRPEVYDDAAASQAWQRMLELTLAPHKAGTPGVNLHCAMHCYRFGDYQKPVAVGADNAAWYEFTGLQTTGHGPQQPIAIKFAFRPRSRPTCKMDIIEIQRTKG